MANRNWASGGKIYSMHVSPVLIDCNFQVDATQPEGISNLKGPAVAEVLMHSTHATPSATIAAGTIFVKLSDNYNRQFLSCKGSIISPASGSSLKVDNSELTAGVAYRITTLGTSTAAQLQAIGFPAGLTPAVGDSFIATTVGAGANTSTTRVQAAATAGSGVCTIELAADPSNTSSFMPTNQGAQFIFQCRDYAGSLVAPTAGSVISFAFYLSNSSIEIAGE